MSSPRTNYVKNGVWIDSSRWFGSQSQWLMTTNHSNILTNLLGILVTIALARVFRLIIRALQNSGKFNEEPGAVETIAWRTLRSGIDTILPGAIHLGPAQPIPAQRWKEATHLLGLALGLIIVFLAFLTCGVLTARLANNSTALSEHPRCGLYLPKERQWPNNKNITMPYESAAQIESAVLSESCFGDGNTDCGTFLDPAISIDISNSTCPWPESICFGHDIKPIRLTTDAVSARQIGINSAGSLEFNRTTICSPLNMNRTYVNLVSQEGSKYTFGYYYGRSTYWPSTSYETIRRGDRGDIPSYQVAVLWSDGDPMLPWQPIGELLPEPGSSTTLVIVVSQKINHLQKSLDPIFPAEDEMIIPGDPRQYYINLSGPGTVLGCFDRTEWRDPSLKLSWTPLSQLPNVKMKDSKAARALYFLIHSLVGSDINSSLNLRLAAALNAQARISGFVSLPLDKEQWKTEVEQLFKTSLARIMINARDIARGAQGEYWGFTKRPPTEIDICQETYLMESNGWTNVNFTGFLWILFIFLILIILSIPVNVRVGNDDEEGLSIEKIPEMAEWVKTKTLDGLGWVQSQWRRIHWPSWTAIRAKISSIIPC